MEARIVIMVVQALGCQRRHANTRSARINAKVLWPLLGVIDQRCLHVFVELL
jgi:hypothetical protein